MNIHEITHFLNHYLVVAPSLKLLGLYLPIKTFFRRLWWKAWGHDPGTNPDFYLSQINFGNPHWQLTVLKGYLIQMIQMLYRDKAKIYQSKGLRLILRKERFEYIPYNDYKRISEWESLDAPGPAALKWLMETDGISQLTIDYRLADPDFKALIDRINDFKLINRTT